jgi:hypothetical protein
VSDGFVPTSSIEPIPGTKPRFQHLEERPAAFWKSPEEGRKRKLIWKETALMQESAGL